MKKLFIFMSLAALLSACETTYRWHKTGMTMEQTENKIAQCQYDIRMNRSTQLDQLEMQQAFNACMKKDGFRWRAM